MQISSDIDTIFKKGYECAVNTMKERKVTNTIVKSKVLKLLNINKDNG